MNQKLSDIKKNFAQWYQDVIYQADLADQSPVRGCIVIKPYGCAIWEHIQRILDRKIKATGHQNALFPLLIPESFLKREAQHIEGFSPELAVVTHAGGEKLAEPLVVRPTSETMIHYMFAQWIKSWRDLPLKINQWANVVRWEMRPRAFLRTSEFFWQEGHTAHATQEEALQEALCMLGEYKDLAENYLAIPVITGKKSEGEKFPGADVTYTFEAFMPDARALQMGTSHMLSQSFAVSFDMKFQDSNGTLQYPWLTSWGATTRLVGAVVMTHGDQKGLVLPPKIAPIQAVIIPIFKTDQEKEAVLVRAQELEKHLTSLDIRTHIDQDPHKTPGNKFYHWELKGVPVRIELGPRDVAAGSVTLVDRLGLGKISVSFEDTSKAVTNLLETIQKTLFMRAQERLKSQWIIEKDLETIISLSDNRVVQTGFCLSKECEKELKPHRLSVRCLLETKECSVCCICKKPSVTDCIVARSY